MAFLGPEGFDANQYDPMRTYEAVPAGRYLATIVSSEMKPTKAGDGEYLELKFQIIEGEYRGRPLFSRLNLRNRSQQAVGIAKAELSSVCRAAGVMTPRDSAELHDVPMLLEVRCRKREDTGDMANEIRGYFPREAAPETTPARARADPRDKPPWESV